MNDEARTAAATALRKLGHLLMARDPDPEVLERLAATVRSFRAELGDAPPRERDLVALKRRMFEQPAVRGERISHFDECFVSGRQNPMGVAIEVWRDGDEMVADVHLGAAFEGAPGRSHGGIVAAVFDDISGYLLTMLRQPAFTGELAVRYLAAVPIDRRLEFRARVTGWEGRRILTAAEATADGEVVATATATFVTVELDRLRS